jgi:hypothetical protein
MSNSARRPRAEISVLIDSRIYIYLFEPIVRGFRAADVRLHIYVPARLRDDAQLHFGMGELTEYLDLDPIKKKSRWRWMIHRLGMDVFVRDDFSFQMFKKKNEITKKLPPLRSTLVKLTKYVPKVPNRSINAFLGRLGSFGMANPFKTKTVIVGSLNASAELLGARKQSVITVMESWDHAVKVPNGYASDMVFTWNEALAVDWQRSQGDNNVHVFYPLKLRYARDVVHGWPPVETPPERPFFVYSVASTHRFSIGILVKIEDRLIRDLACAAVDAGWDLFIKPRPNGENGEFDAIMRDFPNVRVGSIVEQVASQPADYFLSESYNETRFDEIRGATFILNAFTTFGLDAAAAGLPVLQLDLRQTDGYADSAQIFDNYHLKNYILPREHVFRPINDFVGSFKNIINNSGDIAENYSNDLEKWLFNGRREADAIADLIEKTIELANADS